MTNIFKYTLFGLRAKLSERRAAKVRERKKAEVINTAIDHLIDGIDPNMRLVIGYRKKLTAAVSMALSYIDQLVNQIPGPVVFNKQSFSTDPQVNAFFATASDLQKTFSQSEALRQFFADSMHINVDTSFALMCMEKKEQSGFGVQLEGDLIKKDVPQVTVNFFGHNILSPAATEKEVRRNLKQCIFDALISNVFERVMVNHMREGGSDEYRKVLDRRYKANQAWGQELTDLLLSIRADALIKNGNTWNGTPRKQQNERNGRYIETPEDHLEQVNNILAHPENMVRLNHIRLNLSRMGVKVEEGSEQLANRLELAELEINDIWRRIIVLVRYPRNEMLKTNDLFSHVTHSHGE